MGNYPDKEGNRAVAIWLMIGVGMIIVQVLLGGITRLTGSGLSITEWDVVTGALPPIGEEQWLQKFKEYQQTPQYHLLNTHFTLSDFKFIFFWEWFHRVWARLLGLVFLIGFVYLVAKSYLKKEMINPMLGLFLLGALQGAVGWIMVASGLTGDAVYVKPTKLALHFILALGLLCYTYWFAIRLWIPGESRKNSLPIKRLSRLIIVLLGIQLCFGALLAGHKAATVAPTWPGINGDWLPQGLWKNSPILLNFIDNPLTIHFVHRNLGGLILILVILLYRKYTPVVFPASLQKWKRLPLALVAIQVLLGILSLVTSREIVPNRWGNFEWMAQLHQLVAMLLLLSLVTINFLFVRPAQRA